MREGFSHDTQSGNTGRVKAPVPDGLRESHPLVTPPALPTELERQAAGLPTLPDLDPVAFLGTSRHPVSLPPTVRDVEPAAPPRPTEHRKLHRTGLVLVAGALLVPFFFGIARTSSSDDARAGAANPTTLAALESIPVTPVLEEPARVTHATATNASIDEDIEADAPPVDVELPAVQIGSFPAPRVREARPAERGQPGRAFDFAAAMEAVASSGVGQADCGPEAVGNTTVSVTFAPSGEATRARVEDGALRGTGAGSCIALRLRRVRVAPFDGGLATVRTTIVLR
jgi:hypothetical protein